MENLLACPICNSNLFVPFIKCVDYTVSRETFQIVQCETCGFKFTNPRPDQTQIGKYYESDDYISHSNSKKGIFNQAYQFVRNIALKNKLKLIESLNPAEKKLLDIGCGTGEFLKTIKAAGWQTLGLEPSENARTFATNENNLDVKDLDFFQKIQPGSFDIITMWHVLEHVPDLHEFVTQLKTILKVNGKIVIAVPNSEAFESNIYNNFWAAYDLPRHLNHFSIETITNLFKTNGLTVLKTFAMPFDAYYISMLSEKYKGAGFLKMGLNGFINGIKSNRASSKNVRKSSSIIYIIERSS